MWFLERLHLDPERLLRGGNGLFQGRVSRTAAATPATCTNVLTPDRIPEFCIPPRLAPCLAPTALREPRGEEAGTDDCAGSTDWDPRSQAALSLPHLPRARTAYGFCALLESPHTRRKESLFLGSPAAAALPRPPAAPVAPRARAHTYGGGDVPGQPLSRAPAGGPLPPRDALAALPRRRRRLLRAPEGLLSRARRARRSLGLARARSASSGDEDDEPPVQAPSARPPPAPAPAPQPELLEAEGTVTLGRAGAALRLAAQYSPASGRLRVRLLRAGGPAGGGTEPRAVGCRVSFVLQPPGKARRPRGAVLLRSRKAVLDQDLCLDGLSEDEVRRLAVRVKAEPQEGRGLEWGEVLLGSLLLP